MVAGSILQSPRTGVKSLEADPEQLLPSFEALESPDPYSPALLAVTRRFCISTACSDVESDGEPLRKSSLIC
jgi:hypothetical protein